MANLVVHFEIHASQPQRLIDFSKTLGKKEKAHELYIQALELHTVPTSMIA